MTDVRSIAFCLPDIDAMSDEELALFAPENDGRWTSQTKELLNRFHTTRLDLNINWARTPVGWICPVCGRGKQQIARMTKAGVLRCKIERHHDHLVDYCQQIFDYSNPRNEVTTPEATKQRDIARDAVATLTARFAPLLICADCNAAEGKAKAGLQDIAGDFSFRPSEIARFIVPHNNKAHKVDLEMACETWEVARVDFEDRVDFARRMASRFAKGKNRTEILPVRRVLPFSDSNYFTALVAAELPEKRTSLSVRIERRSVCCDGDGEFSVRQPLRASRGPTDEEFQKIERLMGVGVDNWRAAGEDWTCKCCHRNKRQICRVSNRNKWTARIYRIHEWDHETDPFSLRWRRSDSSSGGQMVIGAQRVALICQDCRDVITRLQRQHPQISDAALGTEGISAVLIEVSENGDHKVDYEKAFSIAEANSHLVSAVEDYERHKAKALDVSYSFRRKIRYSGMTNEEILGQLSGVLVGEQGASYDESRENHRWLVREGLRFQSMLAAEKARFKVK